VKHNQTCHKKRWSILPFPARVPSPPVTTKPPEVRMNSGSDINGIGGLWRLCKVLLLPMRRKRYIQIFQTLQTMIVGLTTGPEPRPTTRLRLENKEEGFVAHLSASLCVHCNLETYRYSVPLLGCLFSTHFLLSSMSAAWWDVLIFIRYVISVGLLSNM
jgi:hypothetical protein